MSEFLSTKILGDLAVTGITKLKGLSLTDLIVNGTTTLNGESTINNTMKFPDNKFLYFGDGNDGYFYSDGTNSQGNISIMTITNEIRLPQGIASSDPVITNVSDGDTGINFPVAAQIDLITSSIPRMSIKDTATIITNNVGIGTDSPDAKLDVEADGIPTSPVIKATVTNDTTWIHGAQVMASNITTGHNIISVLGRNGATNNAGYLGFNYASDGSVNNRFFMGFWNNDNLFNILADGNVGIGTTSPGSYKLRVEGTGFFNGSLAAASFIDASNGAYYLDPANTGTSLNIAGDVNLQAGRAYRWLSGNAEIREGSYDLIFKNWDGVDSLDETMRIKSGGNVGIGVTDPQTKLHGAGTFRFDLGKTYTITDVPDGSLMLGNASASTSAPTFVSRSDDNVALIFEARSLDTKTGSSDMMFNIRENDNTDYTTLTGGGFAFRRYTTDLMTIDRAGNVMILGDLQVTGTTTTNNVEMVSTSNGVVFEGTVVDDFELTLLAGALTADRTVTLKDRSGTILLAEDLQDYSINPLFGTTIGMGNDTQVLFFNDSNSETLANYWTSKDGFEIRGDSNLINSVVLKTGNLYLSQNGYINGNLGINGNLKFETANQRNALDLNNNKIIGVDSLALSDSGPDGYIQIGSWSIWNSPNDLTTNSDGNFQFVTGGVRKATINTSGQLELPVATGTAPFIVSSTTKVANLNVDLLDDMSATSSNTASSIVARDASGNFSAGAVTLAGSLSYNDVSRYWLNTSTNWGIYWDTTDNRIEFHGAGNDRASIDLDTGDALFTGDVTSDEVNVNAVNIETWRIEKDVTTNSLKFIYG